MSTETMSIVELITQIVACLVDHPEEVKITEIPGDRTSSVNIIVKKSDVGKIIGKDGKVIEAIRLICEHIASRRKQRISIIVID